MMNLSLFNSKLILQLFKLCFGDEIHLGYYFEVHRISFFFSLRRINVNKFIDCNLAG